MVDQKWYIFPPVPQGQDQDRDHVQSVVKVFPELALFNRLFQVPVSGRNDPQVNLYDVAPSYARKFLFLKHSQQIELKLRSDVPYLI